MRKEKELYSIKRKENWVALLWFYLGAGVEQGVNKLKYYYGFFVGIGAFYAIGHWLSLVYIALAGIPVLIFIGWVWIRYIAKRTEYWERTKTTYWGMYQIELQEKTNKLLEELIKKNV